MEGMIVLFLRVSGETRRGGYVTIQLWWSAFYLPLSHGEISVED